MVAMSGRIIPAPFAIPVTVNSRPATVRRTERPLGTVSVVMMARAARGQPSSVSAVSAAGSAATMRSTGSGAPITPVEKGSTASAHTPPASARAAQVRSASSSPRGPVPAFALPELTSR